MNLLDELTELYWSLGEYSIDDRRRMKAVIYELAAQIRSWAPDEGQARICYLAINEIADRLIRESNPCDSSSTPTTTSTEPPQEASTKSS
jgi:hypothetical protein